MLWRFRLERMRLSAQTARSFDHREEWLFCERIRVSLCHFEACNAAGSPRATLSEMLKSQHARGEIEELSSGRARSALLPQFDLVGH